MVLHEKKTLEDKNLSLQKQVVALRATTESLQKGKNSQKAKLAQLQAQVASLEIDLANKSIKLDELKKVEQENQTLRNSVRKCKKDIEKAEPLVKSLSAECKELKKESKQLKEAAETLEKYTQSELSDLRSELQKARASAMASLDASLIAMGLNTATGANNCQVAGISEESNLIVLTGQSRSAAESTVLHANKQLPKSHTDKPPATKPPATKPPATKLSREKIQIRLVGDSTVRGMGPLMQSNNASSLVVTKPGAGVSRIASSIEEQWGEDVLVVQCGINDIGSQRLVHTINNYTDMIDDAISKHPHRPIIVNEIPAPGGLFKYELRKEIKDLNICLAKKCSQMVNVHFLPLGLSVSQMNGTHVQPEGQRQMANKILSIVESLDCFPNFTKSNPTAVS